MVDRGQQEQKRLREKGMVLGCVPKTEGEALVDGLLELAWEEMSSAGGETPVWVSITWKFPGRDVSARTARALERVRLKS